MITAFWSTLWAAGRAIRKSPLLTAAIVVTLAIAIGATTAIFSVVDTVLLRPLPFPDPGRLMMVWMDNRQQGYDQYYVSLPDYRDIKDASGIFETAAPHAFGTINLGGVTPPQALYGAFVAPELLTALGAKTSLGRLFNADASKAGHEHVVILSHKLWQKTFGGEAGVVGRSLSLNHEAYTVVGIAEPGFGYPINFDISGTISPQEVMLWLPLSLDREKIGTADLSPRSTRVLQILAKLRPGVTPEAAKASLQRLGANLAQRYPESNKGWGMTMKPLERQMTAGVRSALWMLMVAVVAVVLMACANIANLLLAQAAGRDVEMAIRAALGAGRHRILAQLLTESLLYSLAGALFGLLVAYGTVRFLWTFAPGTVPRLHDAGLNGEVILFLTGILIMAALLFGLWPAILISRQSLAQVLRAGGGRGNSSSRRLTRDALVVAEFALASALLIASGLMMKSFAGLMDVHPGFQPEHVAAVSYYLPAFSYPDEPKRALFLKKLLAGVSTSPGVEGAGSVDWLPFSGDEARGGFEIEGERSRSAAEKPQANYRSVSPDYFRTMRIELHQGRFFSERDNAKAKPVVVINQTLARKYFAGADPTGRRINLEDPPAAPVWREIVGVVSDVKQLGLSDAAFPDVYQPAWQKAGDLFQVVVRSPLDVSAVETLVRRATAAVDPDQPTGTVSVMRDLISASLSKERIYALLLAAFAAIAFLLALVGVCGVTLSSIAQRTREIGIRLAIGAEPADIRRMILWQSARLAGAGVLIGVAAGVAITRSMSSLLYGVSATDTTVFVGAPLVLGLLALVISFLAGRRAVAIDPVVALRQN